MHIYHVCIFAITQSNMVSNIKEKLRSSYIVFIIMGILCCLTSMIFITIIKINVPEVFPFMEFCVCNMHLIVKYALMRSIHMMHRFVFDS